jgi:outer membrane receptor for ferrienterochelin and colicin
MFAPSKKFSLLAGMRVDQHNLYGTFYTPRLHLRYQVAKNTTLRGSVGRGYRIANVFAENTNILTSNRTLQITESLDPEVGWNYGVSFIQEFKLFSKEGTLTLDGYRTDFENQVVVDVDTDPHAILIYNLKGDAFSNVAQAELSYTPIKNFDVRAAYKYIDSRSTYEGTLESVPLTFNHRGLINLAYNWKKTGFVFDMTAQGYGASRLPDLSENHAAHDLGTTSEPYMLILAQVTKKFGDLELYAGSDNLTNYTQHMPIIGYDEPFGEDFDAGVIYAPVMERKFYGGLRYTFN